jgi:hypothetical protein
MIFYIPLTDRTFVVVRIWPPALAASCEVKQEFAAFGQCAEREALCAVYFRSWHFCDLLRVRLQVGELAQKRTLERATFP